MKVQYFPEIDVSMAEKMGECQLNFILEGDFEVLVHKIINVYPKHLSKLSSILPAQCFPLFGFLLNWSRPPLLLICFFTVAVLRDRLIFVLPLSMLFTPASEQVLTYLCLSLFVYDKVRDSFFFTEILSKISRSDFGSQRLLVLKSHLAWKTSSWHPLQ